MCRAHGSSLFPYTTLFRSLMARADGILGDNTDGAGLVRDLCDNLSLVITGRRILVIGAGGATRDRKSTRLNSSHVMHWTQVLYKKKEIASSPRRAGFRAGT